MRTPLQTPVTVFGEPLPDWMTDICSTEASIEAAMEQHMADYLKELEWAAQLSLNGMDYHTVRILKGIGKPEEHAYNALRICAFVTLFQPFKAPVREFHDKVDYLPHIQKHGECFYRFAVFVVQTPNGHIYRRLLTLDAEYAAKYLLYAAIAATINSNSSFATYETPQ